MYEYQIPDRGVRSGTPAVGRLARRVAAAAAAVVLLAGCGSSGGPNAEANSTDSNSTDAEPRPGGVLRATMSGEPTTLDPHKRNSTDDWNFRNQVFDGLTVDDSGVGGVKPALAESWDSTDGLTWTFKLRQGVTFHDGSELTADDVKFSIGRVLDPAVGASGQVKPVADRIANVTVVDKHTVEFELKQPEGTFPLEVAELKIVRPDFDPAQPVGTGPYKFVEWVRNQHIKLVKFPDYFEEGLPYLDEVVFLPTPDENQRVDRLVAGEVDFVDQFPLSRVVEAEGNDGIQLLPVEAGTTPSAFLVLARTDQAPLNDVRVRQAISYAIDRQAAVDVSFGLGTVRSQMIPPEHWAFNPDTTRYNERDVAEAKQLLADAGYPDGFELELKHFTRTGHPEIAQLLQSNLKDIGITLSLSSMELGVWIDEVLTKHDFQLGLTGSTPGYDPDPLLSRVYEPTFANGKASAWTNAEFSDLVRRARASVDEDERRDLYFQAQEIIDEEAPAFVVTELPVIYAGTPALRGYFPHPLGRVDLRGVWLDE